MRILTRYLLREFLTVFLLALSGITLMMMLGLVAQEAVRQGVGPGPIIRLLPYVLPNALRFAVPATILLAACTVFGRMSAENEIVALKSAGISPVVLVVPALVVAFLVSLTAVWLNDVAVSWGRKGMYRVVLESVEEIAYGMLRTQGSYSSPQFSMNVREVQGRTLVRPTFNFHGDDDSPSVEVTARTAELQTNPENNTLLVFLTKGQIMMGDAIIRFDDTQKFEIPLTQAAQKGANGGSPSDYALSEIPEQIEYQQRRIEQLNRSNAGDAATLLLMGEYGDLSEDDWAARRAEVEYAQSTLHRLRTEPWRRWANGFSCFFFVMIGAPMAIRARSANLFAVFGRVFIPILLLYYPLLVAGVGQAKVGAVPPATVWVGNLLLALVAIWLMRKVIRY